MEENQDNTHTSQDEGNLMVIRIRWQSGESNNNNKKKPRKAPKMKKMLKMKKRRNKNHCKLQNVIKKVELEKDFA